MTKISTNRLLISELHRGSFSTTSIKLPGLLEAHVMRCFPTPISARIYRLICREFSEEVDQGSNRKKESFGWEPPTSDRALHSSP